MQAARRIVFILLLACSGLASAGMSEFTDGSLAAIQEQRAGNPFVLVMWSVDCAPCMGELEMLKKIGDEHPELDLVLVSVDGLQTLPDVNDILGRHGLEDADNWIFTDAYHIGLRYQVDSKWYGELPRAYLYAADHSRRAVSGTLDQALLSDWLQREAARKHN